MPAALGFACRWSPFAVADRFSVGARVGAASTIESIGSVATFERIVSLLPEEEIVAVQAVDHIVTGPSLDSVRIRVTVDCVAEWRAEDAFDTDEGIGAFARRGSSSQVHGHGASGEDVRDLVDAAATTDDVIPRASEEPIRAFSAVERIVEARALGPFDISQYVGPFAGCGASGEVDRDCAS